LANFHDGKPLFDVRQSLGRQKPTLSRCNPNPDSLKLAEGLEKSRGAKVNGVRCFEFNDHWFTSLAGKGIRISACTATTMSIDSLRFELPNPAEFAAKCRRQKKSTVVREKEADFSTELCQNTRGTTIRSTSVFCIHNADFKQAWSGSSNVSGNDGLNYGDHKACIFTLS
jgi:hypothetical protein